MRNVKTYRDLRIWKESLDLVESIYRITSELPGTEKFGLTNQLRRAAVSIPANIAEGHGRGSRQDFARFLFIARGSLAELETELVILQRLKFVQRSDLLPIWNQCQDIGKMMTGLIRSLRASPKDENEDSVPE